MERSGTPVGFALLLLFALAFGWVAFDDRFERNPGAVLTSYDSASIAAAQAQPPLVWPDDVAGPLTDHVGRRVTADGLRVTSVDADEGFWVEKNGRQAWIQLAEPVAGERPPESPYRVEVGDVVSMSGSVYPHEANYPSRIYFCPNRDASFTRVSDAGVHLAVAIEDLRGADR
jgi:hypothetical protein